MELGSQSQSVGTEEYVKRFGYHNEVDVPKDQLPDVKAGLMPDGFRSRELVPGTEVYSCNDCTLTDCSIDVAGSNQGVSDSIRHMDILGRELQADGTLNARGLEFIEGLDASQPGLGSELLLGVKACQEQDCRPLLIDIDDRVPDVWVKGILGKGQVDELRASRDELFAEFLSFSDMGLPGETDHWNVPIQNAYIASTTQAIRGVDPDLGEAFRVDEARRWVDLRNERFMHPLDGLEGEFWAHDTTQAREMFHGLIESRDHMFVFVDPKET